MADIRMTVEAAKPGAAPKGAHNPAQFEAAMQRLRERRVEPPQTSQAEDFYNFGVVQKPLC